MKGPTLSENATPAKLLERFCTLQYDKAVIEDQQKILMEEMKGMKE